MTKNLRRFFAVFTTLAVTIVTFALPALAAPEYTPLKLTSKETIPLVKQWVWPELDNIPDIYFQFTMKSDSSASGDEKPGEVPGLIQTQVNMSSNREIKDDYIEKTSNISLSGLTFKEPGIYSFRVSESKSYTPGDSADRELINSYDLIYDSTQYNIKVEVGTEADGTTLSLVGIWAEKTDAPGQKLDRLVFRNVSQAQTVTDDLTVQNIVVGDDTSGNFTFTINSLKGAEGEYTVWTESENRTITVDADGNVTNGTFVLKNGESFKIQALPVGTQYSITESDPGDNYVVTIGRVESMTAEGKVQEGGTVVAFVNTYQQPTPTGIWLDVLPFALLAVLIVAAIVVLARKRRN